MNKIVIITSYLDTPFAIENCVNSNDYIICTDGGYDVAMRHKLVPNLLMGDFDSIGTELPDDIETERFKPEKDFTDLELAIMKAVDLSATEVCIIGGIGGRLDHTVANIQMLSHYSECFDSLYMMDGRNRCFIINGGDNVTVSVPYVKDSYISLFSLSETCEGVSARNVKYVLDGYTMSRQIPLGVSNEFTDEKNAVISVKCGTLLVVVSGK